MANKECDKCNGKGFTWGTSKRFGQDYPKQKDCPKCGGWGYIKRRKED